MEKGDLSNIESYKFVLDTRGIVNECTAQKKKLLQPKWSLNDCLVICRWRFKDDNAP